MFVLHFRCMMHKQFSFIFLLHVCIYFFNTKKKSTTTKNLSDTNLKYQPTTCFSFSLIKNKELKCNGTFDTRLKYIMHIEDYQIFETLNSKIMKVQNDDSLIYYCLSFGTRLTHSYANTHTWKIVRLTLQVSATTIFCRFAIGYYSPIFICPLHFRVYISLWISMNF